MTNRLVEHLFFFGLLGFTAYIMWQIIAPFAGAFALAVILATVCYPLYEHILKMVPKRSASIASLLTILFVTLIVLVPLSLIAYLLVGEAVSFYNAVSSGGTLSIAQAANDLEGLVQQFIPGFSIDVAEYAGQVARWLSANVGSIFAGTASTAFLLVIAFVALFYLFRDGKRFARTLVHLSPLPDAEDEQILTRMAHAVRSIVFGTLTVAVLQGVVTAIGLSIFGIQNAILLGSIAAVGALVPAVGTAIVFVPLTLYLIFTGSYGIALGVGLWGAVAVGLMDNVLKPYLVGRRAALHPFLVLIAVLGGISLFGPLGFILGPVSLAFFTVLLELYSVHMSPQTK